MLFRKKYDTSHDIAESFFECQRDGLTIRGTHYRPEGENLPIAIVSHGFMAFQDTVRQYAIELARFDPKNIPERISCGPMKLGRCYVSYVIGMGLYEEIMDYLNDVLIVHGTKDRIVKLDYSRKAYEMYKNTGDSNRRVVLKILEGGAHGFSRRHDAIAMEWMREFVEEQRGKTYEEDESCH